MRIDELLTFHGSPCTKDCSGHAAGYNWAKQHPMTPAASPSKSFNNGAAIAKDKKKKPQELKKPVSNDLPTDQTHQVS